MITLSNNTFLSEILKAILLFKGIHENSLIYVPVQKFTECGFLAFVFLLQGTHKNKPLYSSSDGTEYSVWINSSNLTILNSLPVVTLSDPPNNNVTTNRTPEFTWTATDADDDSMTYQVNISLVGASTCSDSERADSDFSTQNYTPSPYLNCFADNMDYYTWTVRANDSTGYGSWANSRKINISSVVTISLPVDNINFGSLLPDNSTNTTTDSPPPLLLQNDGNCMLNITLNATDLWNSIPGNSSYFQFKIDNNSAENYSFNWGLSNTSWAQVFNNSQMVIVEINWSDTTDSAEIDFLVTVPNQEPPGNKSSVIYFTGSLAE